MYFMSVVTYLRKMKDNKQRIFPSFHYLRKTKFLFNIVPRLNYLKFTLKYTFVKFY